MTDVQLLEQHRGGCQTAFDDLVRRHLGWVYGVARRRLRDAHLAEDVAQAVFVLLHRKSPRFTSEGAVINWLQRTAWYTTETAARSERRRKIYETDAAIMRERASGEGEPSEWRELAPILDELISHLSRPDREAILLRYYREWSYAEVAAEMGTSEGAARKRVERAIEKLRNLAERKGLTIPSAALTVYLGSRLIATPPAGLLSTTTVAATAQSGSALAAASGPIVKGAVAMMTASKMATIAGVAAIFGILGGTAISVTWWLVWPASPPVVIASPRQAPAVAEVSPARLATRQRLPAGLSRTIWLNGNNYVHIDVPNDRHLDLGEDATIEAWVRFRELPRDSIAAIASKDEGENGSKWIFGYGIHPGGGATMFRLYGQGSGLFIWADPWAPVLGQWYHLALVKNGGQFLIYRDGKLDGAIRSNFPVPQVNADFQLGQAEGKFRLDGDLGYVRLWNRARSAGEILSQMNSELKGNEPGLMGNWMMTPWSGNTILDTSAYHTVGEVAWKKSK
jgi:RNA polymerase sigma factor (sigma-70 family)